MLPLFLAMQKYILFFINKKNVIKIIFPVHFCIIFNDKVRDMAILGLSACLDEAGFSE
jgi:uncharacterized membrane protein YjjB (DUF3815 family)